jgi:hypothetical protein
VGTNFGFSPPLALAGSAHPNPAMKTPRFIRFACFALLVFPAALSAKEEVLLDFKSVHRDRDGPVFKCYQYTFEAWGGKKVMDLPGKGALVQAPSGKGGIGENKSLIRFDKTPKLNLYFIIGNANKANAINFSLTDKDGTEQSWAIPLASLPKGSPQKFPIDLTKPTAEAKPGKTPGLDLKKIGTWQIRGDYSDLNVEVLIDRLSGEK